MSWFRQQQTIAWANVGTDLIYGAICHYYATMGKAQITFFLLSAWYIVIIARVR